MMSATSSLARIWKMSHSYPGCSFIWKIPVVYLSVKHSYLCNKQPYVLNTYTSQQALKKLNKSILITSYYFGRNFELSFKQKCNFKQNHFDFIYRMV